MIMMMMMMIYKREKRRRESEGGLYIWILYIGRYAYIGLYACIM